MLHMLTFVLVGKLAPRKRTPEMPYCRTAVLSLCTSSGVYSVPHFDFHFMFTSPEDWWGAQWGPNSQGPCMGGSNETFFNTFKPVPASCWPGNVAGPITQMGDFVWGVSAADGGLAR
jgi:hypothetical protein